jgi:hypothetical protein
MVLLGAPTHPAMNIFVPFTRVQPWTMAAMLWYLPHTQFVDVSGDEWDYLRFFEARWAERKTFISVEHDVVPAPGIIDSMWSCPHGWCVGHYSGPPTPVCYSEPYVPPFGLVKFSADFIRAVPDVWADRRALGKTWKIDHAHAHKETGGCCGETAWWALDTWLGEYVFDNSLGMFHDHWPLVTHGGKSDALYGPIRVTDPDGTWIRDHELSTKTIELSLKTL